MKSVELQKLLNWEGAEKQVRKLVLSENLASEKELALMSQKEVLDIVCNYYEFVFFKDGDVALVKKENKEKLDDLLTIISPYTK